MEGVGGELESKCTDRRDEGEKSSRAVSSVFCSPAMLLRNPGRRLSARGITREVRDVEKSLECKVHEVGTSSSLPSLAAPSPSSISQLACSAPSSTTLIISNLSFLAASISTLTMPRSVEPAVAFCFPRRKPAVKGATEDDPEEEEER